MCHNGWLAVSTPVVCVGTPMGLFVCGCQCDCVGNCGSMCELVYMGVCQCVVGGCGVI